MRSETPCGAHDPRTLLSWVRRYDDAFKTYDQAVDLASEAEETTAGTFGFAGVGDGYMKAGRAKMPSVRTPAACNWIQITGLCKQNSARREREANS
jgi:hypothetical protein